MSRLKVNLRGAMISEIELRQDKEYTGGRRDGCDIRLQAEKGISREHFKLKFADGRWNLQAISRFGDIFSLGQKIESIPLDHGQTFQIPPYEFQFIDVPESDVTSALPNDALNIVSENEKTVIGVAPQVPYLKLINSNGEIREMLRLEVGEIWVAGRDPSCQIVIPDQRVSRRQFEIHKVNGNYTIIDLGSVNGTFLNGSPVSSTDPQTLKSGDAITVLDNTMYFELHDPNFKYKVDKIDVPPLQYEQPPADDFFQVSDENQPAGASAEGTQIPGGEAQVPMQIPEIPQDGYGQPGYGQAGYDPSMDPNGGMFTGMPPGADPNQYYTFNQQPPPEQAQPKGLKKLLQNRPLLAIIAVIILAGAFYLSENMTEEAPTGSVTQTVDPNDPLAKLTPEQRNQVKELYAIGEQMHNQQKYDLAIEKFTKIKEIIQEGYLNTDVYLKEAQDAIFTKEEQERDAERQKEEEEAKKKIAEIEKTCSVLLTDSITVDQMRECLAPMAQIDVTVEPYTRLMAEAEKLQRDRELREEQAKQRAQEEANLVELFQKAEELQKQGFAFKAIKQYRVVIESTLPDPKNLKKKSENRIKYIEEKVAERTGTGVSKADEFVKAGNLKKAIESLRETLVYDPQNRKLKERIEMYREELRRQARDIYHDAIIDETYGVVDSSETRMGAKDKWKKIVEMDIEDGEYYRKAIIKLRRYGVY